MQVKFSDGLFSREEEDSLEHVLDELVSDGREGLWREAPDEINIRRRIAGGRSGAAVLEAVVIRGNARSRTVIKVGPFYALRDEFAAFREHLTVEVRGPRFVPIETVTQRLLAASPPTLAGENEAVVYSHAEYFHGVDEKPLRTFEEIAHEYVHGGSGVTDEMVTQLLARLFDGTRNALYGRWTEAEDDRRLRPYWNRPLGFDAVVAISAIDVGRRHLTSADAARPVDVLHERRFQETSVASDPPKGPVAVRFNHVRLQWWGAKLIGELDAPYFLRFEIVGAPTPIEYLPERAGITDGSQWRVHGVVRSWRTPESRQRLLHFLGAGFSLADGVLAGPDEARAPDPFAGLGRVMDREQAGRINSVVHGDLNPRNVLVVDGQPCLIDYALTKKDQPLFCDFVRLEGCLMMEVLPAELSWRQLLRLQRWLALACRLAGGGPAEDGLQRTIERFAAVLGADRPELGRAFRLLWAIRAAARKVAPPTLRSWWAEDYLEQLFLFGHQMVKWLPDAGETDATKTEAARRSARAAAAILGAAAETFEPARVYELWTDDELKLHAETLLQQMFPSATARAADLASLGRRLRGWNLKANDPRWQAFRDVRQQLVRNRFQDVALQIENQLRNDHDVYISLKAYIDLKGQLRDVPKGKRTVAARAFAETLADDDALAASERLRPDERKAGDDALELVAKHPAVVLLGDAGAGKSTLAREWEYRLAKAIRGTGESPEPRLPIVVRASAIANTFSSSKLPRSRSRETSGSRENDRILTNSATEPAAVLEQAANPLPGDTSLADLCEAGAVAVIVDALNELADAEKQRVAEWIVALRDGCPLLPLLVCHRQYNYPAGLLPFPVITLQKVERRQAERYIRDYLRAQRPETPDANGSPEDLAERLVNLLLKSPDHQQVRDLAQTPLFLWMIVERFNRTRVLPPNRARLFDDFSRWYLTERHHAEHQEAVAARFDYDTKAALLGRLGNELVQRRATELPESAFPVRDAEAAVLEEIVTAELLHREGTEGRRQLRFLHQSFQEYFAARHILPELAANPAEITRRVSEFGWHDTFVLLLGFGGEHPQVVRQVVDAALQVNPRLTARCLRMAEAVEPGLLDQFVAAQAATLADPQAGVWEYRVAAQALAEYGRGAARGALWDVITNRKAPEPARCRSLEAITQLPGQVRFEPLADKLRGEFVERLQRVFDEPAPLEVQRAAMNAVVKVKLTDLSPYLTDLVSADETAWPLRRAAWSACHQLNLPLRPKWCDAYRQACEKRLDALEAELYEESILDRMSELNDERLAILEQLASRENLPLLLSRRFAFIPESWGEDWNERVAELVDELIAKAEPSDTPNDAWTILTKPERATAKVIARWFDTFRDDADLPAQAAAHRLIALGEKLPVEPVRERLASWPTLPAGSRIRENSDAYREGQQPPQPPNSHEFGYSPSEDATSKAADADSGRHERFEPWKLSALARMAAATRDKSLAEPLDQLLRGFIDHVSGREQVGALANLVTALWQLDRRRGHRTAAVADMVFWTERWNDTAPGQFPWSRIECGISLDAADCSALLTSARNPKSEGPSHAADSAAESEQAASPLRNVAEHASAARPATAADPRDVRAAVFFLQAWGGTVAFTANTNSSLLQLSPEAAAAFCELADAEVDPLWRLQFARAAVRAGVVSLVPWAARTADLPETAEREFTAWDSVHGRFVERHLAHFLRAIGFLTRQLLNDNQLAAAQPGIEALEKRRPLLAGRTAFPGRPDSNPPGSEAPPTDDVPDRSIIIGLVTGLGYLGDWQPLLEQLGPGEPWLHRAAKNVFNYWVPGPLAKSPDQERERAAVWIAHRLHRGGLSPEARSTLQEILEDLEQKLGHHIRPDA